jgi:hypothetical protein
MTGRFRRSKALSWTELGEHTAGLVYDDQIWSVLFWAPAQPAVFGREPLVLPSGYLVVYADAPTFPMVVEECVARDPRAEDRLRTIVEDMTAAHYRWEAAA